MACSQKSGRCVVGWLPESLIYLVEVEVSESRAEVLVVEDALIDLVVGVDAGDDRLQELPVEDQAEVVDGVVLGLVG